METKKPEEKGKDEINKPDEMQELLANAKKVVEGEKKPVEESEEEKAKKAESEKQKEKEIPDDKSKETDKEKRGENPPKKEKEFWEEDAPEGGKGETDYKSLFEDTVQQLAAEKLKVEKYEKNYIIKDLSDFLDDPDFDVEKWIDSMKPKDIQNLSVEDLFKLGAKNENPDLNDEELEREWVKKEKEIKDAADDDIEISLANKKLKNKLLKELTPKVDLTKESDYLKTYKENKKNVKALQQAEIAERSKAAKDVTEYLDSLEGKPIQGVPVTKEDIEKAKQSIFDPNFYKEKDASGKVFLNHRKLANDRLLFIKFKDVVTTLMKAQESELKENQVNASANSKSGDIKIEKDENKSPEEKAKAYVDSNY